MMVSTKAGFRAQVKPRARRRTGAGTVIDGLKAEGADLVFGMTGGAIMPVYDALYQDGSLRHIIVGHEQGGAHMAECYARATGKPGVVLTTSGPGATNLVTGLADASMDSIPLVALTGQVPTALIGNDAFQESDVRGITMPVTKYNYLLKHADEVPQSIAEAFHLAHDGRPGPVLVDLPKDVIKADTDAPHPDQVQMDGHTPLRRPPQADPAGARGAQKRRKTGHSGRRRRAAR